MLLPAKHIKRRFGRAIKYPASTYNDCTLEHHVASRPRSTTMALRILLFSLSAVTAFAAPVKLPLLRRGNLPEPIAVSTAKSYLSELTVASEVNSPAYDRDLFKTWISISGNCDTREYVLKRDGSSVQTDTACEATSGSWYSDYDGATWTDASDVDIDHIVPLVSLAGRFISKMLTVYVERGLGIRRAFVD